jgi:hypothetical protein
MPGVIAHACNPVFRKAKQEDWWEPGLHSEFHSDTRSSESEGERKKSDEIHLGLLAPELLATHFHRN